MTSIFETVYSRDSYYLLSRLHEERLERERQLSSDQRRGSLPPTSTPTSLSSSSLLQQHLHQQQQHLFHQHQLQQQQQSNKLHPVSAPYTPTSIMPPTTSSPTPPTSSANSTGMEDPHGTSAVQAQLHQQSNKDLTSNRSSSTNGNGSPVLNLSKGDDAGGQDENRDQDRQDVISHDSDRDRGMHDDEDRQHHGSSRDEERLSEMDDDDMDKDECKYQNFL